MTYVYVSIGSNIEREKNIRAGVAALKARYGDVTLSSVYESEAVGFAGDNFYNLVVGFDTEEDVRQVVSVLQVIEDLHGRERTGPKFSSRTLDLDLLLYDDLIINKGKLQLPRYELSRNAFVLWPMAEIAPELKHPVFKKSYAELWERFDKASQPLWPIEFTF